MTSFVHHLSFLGISAAALAPEEPSTNLDSTISIGPGTTKETKKNPLSQIFQVGNFSTTKHLAGPQPHSGCSIISSGSAGHGEKWNFVIVNLR